MTIINPTYKTNIINSYELRIKHDFHKIGENTIHRFPVYKYNNKPLIMGEFIYDEEEYTIHINAVDINTGTCVPYNKSEYGKSKVTEIINTNILKEIDRYKKEGVII